MCRQLSIRSSVEGVLITLFTTFFLFFYLVCNFLNAHEGGLPDIFLGGGGELKMVL